MTATNMCSDFGGFRWGLPLNTGLRERQKACGSVLVYSTGLRERQKACGSVLVS